MKRVTSLTFTVHEMSWFNWLQMLHLCIIGSPLLTSNFMLMHTWCAFFVLGWKLVLVVRERLTLCFYCHLKAVSFTQSSRHLFSIHPHLLTSGAEHSDRTGPVLGGWRWVLSVCVMLLRGAVSAVKHHSNSRDAQDEFWFVLLVKKDSACLVCIDE